MPDLTTIDGLLAEQKVRAAALNAAIDRTDGLKGHPEHEQAYQDQFAVGALLEATVLQICSYRPRNRDEQVAKATALYRWMGTDNGLTAAETSALINSMVDGGTDA